MAQRVICLDSLAVAQSSIDTLFALESHEHGNRGHQVVVLLVFDCVDGLINLDHVVPALLLDDGAALFEQVDDFVVFEGEGGDGDFDVLDGLVLVAQVGQLVEAPLHFVLDPVAEGLHARHVVFACSQLPSDPVVRFFDDEVVVEVGGDVKLDGVVASSDCLDVPLHVVIFLNFLHVVKVDEDEEGDKSGCRAEEERAYLTFSNLLLRQRTRNLEVHKTAVSLALFSVEAGLLGVDEAFKVGNLAELLASAVFLDLALQCGRVEVAGAVGWVFEAASRAVVAQLRAARNNACREDWQTCVLRSRCQV
mmetsp:Transcript_41367/g.54395  ORF Transcript_41367/g.54395 Transcript_41367/m.54395 type:complete len:307 (+) Transcript_41367:2002-2922(+)